MLTHDIVPTHLVISAMRDSGYKNAAYAIAELMDNSIQAGATQVELLCGERWEVVKQRQRNRINTLAVLDNGNGMNGDVLRIALQFGNGTRLDPENQTGIGRFGMGLPNSSISQARRVDVWSWQDGPENALHTYIDIDEIKDYGLREVPDPQCEAIPDVWLKTGTAFEKTGTLVVWSRIDRSIWRTASAIINNSSMLMGRMYRYFLVDGRVRIRMGSFDCEAHIPTVTWQEVLPTDPLYLLDHTSCPSPFNETSMFTFWGDPMEFKVRFRGETHSVWVKFSVAKEEARQTDNAGLTPHGRHAKENVGVSIVRADRELELDTSWINSYDPRERWWGAEVSFTPALDELFGVTNNKQAARNFSQMAKEDVEQLMKDHDSFTAAREDLEAEEDPRMTLAEIVVHLQKNIRQMRELIQNQTRGFRTAATRHEESRAEKKSTEVTRRRIEEGHSRQGTSDIQEAQQTPEERKVQIVEKLVEQGVAQTQAEQIASQTVGRGFKYAKAVANLESPVFFDVTSRGGSIIVSLNANHPAYPQLVELLENPVEGADYEELKTRLIRAREGFELLFFAWARYEDEQINPAARARAQDARIDWGRIARDFLTEDAE